MKYLLFFLLLSSCLSSSRDTASREDFPNTIDTVFIDKEKDPNLFMDPKPASRFAHINGWGFVKDSSKDWGAPDSCMHVQQNGFSNKWIEIKRLNGQPCFYLWYDPTGLNKLVFCGNDFYEIINSGDYAGKLPILEFVKKSDRAFTYVVPYIDSYGNFSTEEQRIINFYIIDEEEQIAIVEDTKGYDKYQLMIAQAKEYDIPIVVHQDYQNGIHTFVAWDFGGFDEVDYEKILRENGFR